MKPALYVVAAIIEVFGIFLIASPDVIPGAVRLAGWARVWARVRWRMIENRIRRALRLPPSTITHSGTATATVDTAGSVSPILGTTATTIEEKVEFLLRREKHNQKTINALAERIGTAASESRRGLADLRDEMRGHVESALTKAQADYRAARIWGAVLLTVGIVIGTWANLLR